MSRHPSGIQFRSPTPRVTVARHALERLHVVLDETREPALGDLVHAARTFWIAMVFVLAELQEEEPIFWPFVDDEDLDRVAGIGAHHYQALVVPCLRFESHAPTQRAQARLRDAIGEVIDALDRNVTGGDAEQAARVG
ncbi:MAG: hypothetical protein JST00_29810 [Deltaproteobacteria bacterium]|nr:hypothetical protein [Deltaproteobacteria bacterium]